MPCCSIFSFGFFGKSANGSRLLYFFFCPCMFFVYFHSIQIKKSQLLHIWHIKSIIMRCRIYRMTSLIPKRSRIWHFSNTYTIQYNYKYPFHRYHSILYTHLIQAFSFCYCSHLSVTSNVFGQCYA